MIHILQIMDIKNKADTNDTTYMKQTLFIKAPKGKDMKVWI